MMWNYILGYEIGQDSEESGILEETIFHELQRPPEVKKQKWQKNQLCN